MTTEGRAPSRPHDAFFEALAVTCAEIRRSFDRHVGMSQARRQLLTALAEEHEVSHAALAAHLRVDGAAVTRLVKSLESQGAVTRRLDPHDNRFTLASLTEAGEDLVGDLRARHEHYQARLLDGVSQDECEAVLAVLERVRDNIAQIQQAEATNDG